MPISDDAARAEHIRDIAEILARGLQRLLNSRDSVSQSLRDALSFRDKPCSVTPASGEQLRQGIALRSPE